MTSCELSASSKADRLCVVDGSSCEVAPFGHPLPHTVAGSSICRSSFGGESCLQSLQKCQWPWVSESLIWATPSCVAYSLGLSVWTHGSLYFLVKEPVQGVSW